MLRRSVLSLLALLVIAGAANAQPAAGPEFRVNTYTPSVQDNAAVAADANGNFVVVWTSDGQDGHYNGVFGQRFDPLGNPRGTEFAINTITTGYQEAAAVAVHPSGNFVVVWAGEGANPNYRDIIFARRYDASGTPLGPEFQVNADDTGLEYPAPDVAFTPAGQFVVVWANYGVDDDGSAVVARTFDAAGVPGSQFQVNTYTTYYQDVPAVATTPTGDIRVVWVSDTQDGDGYGVYSRSFNTAGTALGPEIRVNTYTTYNQDLPDIAMDASGNFVVVWDSFGQDGSNMGVFGQLFNSTATAIGGEFRVNTYTTNRQQYPSVAREADGHFVVSWQSLNQAGPGAYDDVFAQQFDPLGAKLGPEFRVNSYTTSPQDRSAVASLGKENFVVVWTSYSGQDGDSGGIFAQRLGDLIFRDGFE